MKKLWKITVLAFTAALLFTGCGNKNETEETSTSSSEATAQSSKEEKTLKVTTELGDTEVPLNPKKVVVFDNGSLDTIQALGESKKVVGAATQNLPDYLSDFEKVESAGGIKEPDLEKINQLKPDLIIISGRQSDFADDLQAIAPTLYLTVDGKDPWGSTQKNIETLAKIFGKEDEAKDKIASLQEELDELSAKAKDSKLKALIVLENEGSLSAYGPGSRFGIIHDAFGFEAADPEIPVSTHGNEVNYEYILEKNPDVLFVVNRTAVVGGDTSKDTLATNELVKQTNAGKNDKVIYLEPGVWYLSGGGLESMELMIKDAQKALN